MKENRQSEGSIEFGNVYIFYTVFYLLYVCMRVRFLSVGAGVGANRLSVRMRDLVMRLGGLLACGSCGAMLITEHVG